MNCHVVRVYSPNSRQYMTVSDVELEAHISSYKLISSYIHISNTHNHNTRSVSNNNITTPACKRNSGLRTFPSSACRLWNALDPEPKTLSHTNFKNYLFKLYRSLISSLIILRFVKPFSFISSQLINIVLIVVYYVILVGRLYW